MITAIFAILSGILFSYTKSFIFLFLLNGATQGFLNGMTALTDRLATDSPYAYGSIRLWGSLLYAIGAQVSGFIYEYIAPQANYFIFAGSMVFVIWSFMMIYEKNHVIAIQKRKR